MQVVCKLMGSSRFYNYLDHIKTYMRKLDQLKFYIYSRHNFENNYDATGQCLCKISSTLHDRESYIRVVTIFLSSRVKCSAPQRKVLFQKLNI